MPRAAHRTDTIRRRTLVLGSLLTLTSGRGFGAGTPRAPVRVGLTAERGFPGSTSDDAILAGLEIAVADLNAAGGVLGGRPFELVVRDDRGVPSRGVDNLREMAAMPDLVAAFTSKHSPVALQALPLVHELQLPLLDPWGAADGIIDHGLRPSYTFRLSLRDTWAMEALMAAAGQEGHRRVAVLAPNTAWGRSSVLAAERFASRQSAVKLVATRWYNWGDNSLAQPYTELLGADPQALVLVANELEGAILVKEMAARPDAQRLPVFSHWGVTGGDFFELNREALPQIDFRVVQTFGFVDNARPQAVALGRKACRHMGVSRPEDLPSPVGLAHAHDLMHLLAAAVERAGSTTRHAVRDALEQLPPFDGAVRRYAPAFTPERHEALDPEQVYVAAWDRDGVLRRTGSNAAR